MNDNEKRIIAGEIVKLYLVTSTPMPEATIEAWFSVIGDRPFDKVLSAIKKELFDGEGRPDVRNVIRHMSKSISYGTPTSRAKVNEPY